MKYEKNGLSEKEIKILNSLKSADTTKSEALMLFYMLKVGNATSKDIERHTGLRQPEVSIASIHLAKKGWIKKYPIKEERKGKGRPFNKISLTISKQVVLDEIQKEIQKKIQAMEKSIVDIKEIFER